MNIKVVVDSGCGLTKAEAEAKGLEYLPLQIIDENVTLLDGIDTTPQAMFKKIREGRMMSTSLPPLGNIHKMFRRFKEEGVEHVITFTLSSGLSGTMQSIRMIAEESEMHFTCIETWTTCYIQAYLAEACLDLVKSGYKVDEIITRINESIRLSNTLIIPDDLNHLARGGRLTPMAAALGGMLKIKPILSLNATSGGKIDTFAKVRTMSKAIKKVIETFVESGVDQGYVTCVLHTDALELAQSSAEQLKAASGVKDVFVGTIGPVISVHTGNGCIGLQYIKKVRL